MSYLAKDGRYYDHKETPGEYNTRHPKEPMGPIEVILVFIWTGILILFLVWNKHQMER